MSYKKCCVAGCSSVAGSDVVLHEFPSPEKYSDRFKIWIKCVGGDMSKYSAEYIHTNRRICRKHFETKYLCRNNRLSPNAVPTLDMPCYAVSVNCGEPLGCYQGTIWEADGSTITLTKAFRNGFPYPKSQVTLNAADIKELKIIEAAVERGEPARSTVAVAKGKKQRATVCETLQASQAAPARSKPVDIPRKAAPAPQAATPRAERARRRNEACFGASASPAALDDFDFEGNLALFDKRALWQEMRARPDLLPRASPASYRHDENVVRAPAPAAGACARVPAELRGARDYRTDAGVALPSVTPRARRLLWRALERGGVAAGARSLLARAAADLCLRLAGGGRRLEARNAHQAPRVAVLAGAHAAGAAGLLAARLLSAHGARAQAHVVGPLAACAELAREADAAVDDVPLLALEALGAPDVLLVALHDPAGAGSEAEDAALAPALAWAGAGRAALVLLEPPAAGWAGVSARASLLALAPVLLPASCGRVFLCNVAPPRALLRDLGLEYRAPFAAASLLQLHADTD